MRRLSLLFTAVMTALALVGLTSCGSDNESAAIDTAPMDTAPLDTTVSDVVDNADDAPEISADEAPVDDEAPSSDPNGRLVDRIVASMVSYSDSPFTEDQARCYAEANISVMGANRIEQAVADADDPAGNWDDLRVFRAFDYSKLGMTESDANRIYDSAARCGLNFKDMILEALTTDVDEAIPAAVLACVRDAVTDDSVRNLMVSLMVDDTVTSSAGSDPSLFQALIACDPTAGNF